MSCSSRFVPRIRYLAVGFVLLVCWCLVTLPHLWFAHYDSRSLSDARHKSQIARHSVIPSNRSTSSTDIDTPNLPGQFLGNIRHLNASNLPGQSPGQSGHLNAPALPGQFLGSIRHLNAPNLPGQTLGQSGHSGNVQTNGKNARETHGLRYTDLRVHHADSDISKTNRSKTELDMERSKDHGEVEREAYVQLEERKGNISQSQLSREVASRHKPGVLLNGAEQFKWRPFKAEGVDCSQLFAGNASELQRAKNVTRPAYSTPDIIRDVSNCSEFVTQNGFVTSPLTKVERDFPIAYSILVYRDPAQVIDLLRVIYRPQNYYCLHVDRHTKQQYQQAFRAIAACFNNVFLSSKSTQVHWGKFDILQAEIFCMEDLYKYSDWKYFINLTGQEFPLKTNYEIVRILQALKGANAVNVQDTWKFMERWCRYLPAPHNLTIYKGSTHIAVSRPFVHFILTSPVASDFLHWVRPVKIPDEVFFNTLNHNPQLGIPGSYNGPYFDGNLTHKPHLSSFKNWQHARGFKCAGRKFVRSICILSAGDLPLLDTRPELFANKFYQDYSFVATQCLTEKLYNRTRQQTLGTLSFDVTYYENLPFLQHIVKGSEF